MNAPGSPLVRLTRGGGVAALTAVPRVAAGADRTNAWVEMLGVVADDPAVHLVTMCWPRSTRLAPLDGAAVAVAMGSVAVPLVVAIEGAVDLGGLAVVLASDICIAARGTRFDLRGAGTTAVLRGGLLPRLARAVGPGRATALALCGGRLTLADAVRLGLVRDAVPAPRLRHKLRTLAGALAARGPLALAVGKEAVLRALDLPLADGIKLEHDLYVLLQTTADRREGVAAFLERRPPRFRAT